MAAERFAGLSEKRPVFFPFFPWSPRGALHRARTCLQRWKAHFGSLRGTNLSSSFFFLFRYIRDASQHRLLPAHKARRAAQPQVSAPPQNTQRTLEETRHAKNALLGRPPTQNQGGAARQAFFGRAPRGAPRRAGVELLAQQRVQRLVRRREHLRGRRRVEPCRGARPQPSALSPQP